MSEIKILLLKPCLRLDEAAILLHVTPRTVQRYMDQDKIEYITTPGGQRRVVTESIKRFVR
jgi:excisionase family DNA binding protein